MSVRRSLFVLAVVTLTLPLVVFSWRANQMQARDAGQNLQFYIVGQGDVNVSVTAIGTLEAREVVNLSFTRAEKVIEVLVEPGDMVQAGDILVRQAADVEQIVYDQAVLSWQLAELQKQVLLEPTDDSQILIAEANLNSAWGAYLGIQNAIAPEDIEAAQIQYDRALAAYEAAVQARMDANANQPDQAYQLLDAQVGSASFNVEIARLQLDSLQTGNNNASNTAYARVMQAQKELEKLQVGPSQPEIDQADISIQQAQSELDDAQLALDRMSLFAPADGIVSAVNIQVGALGTPAQPAIELTDISTLHVEAQVDEIDIRQITEGMPASVRLDALPGVEFLAALNQIALVGTNDNGIISYGVQVTLNDSDARARVGMTAEASVIVEQRRDVTLVPNLYIRLERDTDNAFVNLVMPDASLEEVKVALGLQSQDSSEIISGLEVGDVIAIDLSSDRFAVFGG